VPQGSVLGPVLFLLYVVEVIQLVKDRGFCPHAFADNLQVYGHALPTDSNKLLGLLVACIERVQAWMASNRLLLNSTKTEFIWLGSIRQLQTCPSAPLYVSSASILPSQRVRDLGVILDSDLTLTTHVSHIVSVCYFHVRQLSLIRRSLMADTAHVMVHALIHSRLYYYNGVLSGLPAGQIARLQGVLRSAARLVLSLPSCVPVSAAMHDTLHGLDFPQRITYELALLVYKCLHGLAPEYLTRACVLLSTLSDRPHLRSSDDNKLFVPRAFTASMGPWAFCSSGPTSWNTLPARLKPTALITDTRTSLFA